MKCRLAEACMVVGGLVQCGCVIDHALELHFHREGFDEMIVVEEVEEAPLEEVLIDEESD